MSLKPGLETHQQYRIDLGCKDPLQSWQWPHSCRIRLERIPKGTCLWCKRSKDRSVDVDDWHFVGKVGWELLDCSRDGKRRKGWDLSLKVRDWGRLQRWMFNWLKFDEFEVERMKDSRWEREKEKERDRWLDWWNQKGKRRRNLSKTCGMHWRSREIEQVVFFKWNCTIQSQNWKLDRESEVVYWRLPDAG